MKKILFSIAAVASMTLVSCGGKADCCKDASATAITSGIERCDNQDSLRMYVDRAKEHARKLVSEGRVAEAQKYLEEVAPAVDKYAPKYSGELTQVQAAVNKAAGTTGDKVENAKNAVAAAADSVGGAVSEKAGEVKDKTVDKYNDVKDAVSDKASELKDKAADAADNAADKVKDMFDK
ncbi:MAG: hypothetical protein K2L49_00385 [Muribaculaceae bacterium]|nr:hypothetical protein [Muribaculaceae bacterium]